MAEMPPIQIQIDQETLRRQIQNVIHTEYLEFANRLRWAANAIDGGSWQADQDQALRNQYDSGVIFGQENPLAARRSA